MSIAISPAQEFVFYRTYSRWSAERGRRETWPEAVERYFSFMELHFKDKGLPAKVWKESRNKVLNMDVVPSMRALAAAGPALESNHIIGYNCCSMLIKDLQSFAELFYILMCGTGVGFSVEKEFIDQLPIIEKFTGAQIGTHIVGDSREGWATSLKIGLETWFNGKTIDFDYSKVRPKGARLKTMGGRASGPEPLRKLHEFAKEKIFSAQGRRLTSLEVLDLCNMIAEVVVVGGVRRSSQISFSDLEDELIRHAKDFPFPPYRYMSNNSSVYKKKPDMVTFMKEWAALALSGSGERGIFNLETAQKACSRRGSSDYFRTNPCQPASATILTPNGIRTIADIDIGSLIWSGTRWTKVINKWSTGVKEVFKYSTNAGIFVGTENHRILQNGEKIEVKDASAIDIADGPMVLNVNLNPQDIMDGLVIGDGTVHKASNNLVLLIIGEKDNSYHLSEVAQLINRHRPGIERSRWEVTTTIKPHELPKTYEREVPNRFLIGSPNTICGFLRGLYSANGSICGGRVTLKSSSKKIIESVQQMLSVVGIRSYYTTNNPHEVLFNNGIYMCRESYDLNISSDRKRFCALIGFLQPYKMDKLINICDTIKDNGHNKTTYDISKIEFLSTEEVFDLTVDDPDHTYWTGGLLVSNCGEIILRADKGEMCNLSEVIVRSTDTFTDLVEKVKTAVWLGCIQACLTHFPFIRPSFREMCKEERLLGVSLTGQMDNAKLMSPNRLEDLHEIAVKTCRKACKLLGINMSAAITTGKPSGSVSQLTNSSSGAHPRFDKYYIRRYRISATDPLFKMMRSQGIKFYPENGQGLDDINELRQELIKKGRSIEEASVLVPDWIEESVMTWVVEFPEAAPKNAITRDQLTAIDQLEWYLKLKKNWCEHNQSMTVYVRDEEWLKVGSWVYDHFDDVIGVSFLPYDGGHYKQAPYESITKEEYEKRIKTFPKIDYTQLSKFELEDYTSGIGQVVACSAGGTGCELT